MNINPKIFERGSYGRISEIVPTQIWSDALIDCRTMLLFRGSSMPAGNSLGLKGLRLKILESQCSFDEIAQAFNYSVWSFQIENQETKLRFPGSEFSDYFSRSLSDFLFEPVLPLNELVHFQILVEFNSSSHFQPIFGSKIRVTLLGSHYVAK